MSALCRMPRYIKEDQFVRNSPAEMRKLLRLELTINYFFYFSRAFDATECFDS